MTVLLVSSREWFASALQAVLEPEGFAFKQLSTAAEAISDASEIHPDVVIIDEGLQAISAAALCRELKSAGLSASVPILVYSPNFWKESEQAEAMHAGAWDVIREPIRSRILVAKLRRLLHLKELIESSEGSPLIDADTGLYSLAGLMHSLPILGSLAERSGTPLSCSVIGSTLPASTEVQLSAQRKATARLVVRFTRASDLCAVVGAADVALIAYNADAETAAAIVQRLNDRAEGEADYGPGPTPLSAGITDLPISGLVGAAVRASQDSAFDPSADSSGRVASLARLAAAQNALREARASEGGIRIAGQD